MIISGLGMSTENMQYVWRDGKFVDYEKATVHVLTHSLQYGSGIFEGIRSYETEGNVAIFRLQDHVRRFLNSAKICNMKLDNSYDDIFFAIKELVKRNGLKKSYIRPFAFYNDPHIGLDTAGKKIGVVIAAVPFGNYFKNKDSGIKCNVSALRRINPSVLPTQAKASGNYVNSILASIDAKNQGADDAILISNEGFVAEGPAENIFLVSEGKLLTPSKEANILLGITRDTIIRLANSMGIEVEERQIHKEELYTAEEVFFTGTAAEITSIVSVDSRRVGNGKQGDMTKTLERVYLDTVVGKNHKFKDWLTEVY